MSQYLSEPALLIVAGIIFLIVALTVQCLVLLHKAQRALQEERQYFTTASEALKLVSLPELAKQSSPGAYLCSLCAKGNSFPASCLAARYLKRMAYLSNSRLSSADHVLDLVQRWSEGRAGYVRYIAGMLVFLALFGTVTSLWMSLRSLPNFNTDTPDLNKLNQVISHMLPAFFVTGIGILGTVIVSWRNNLYTQGQEVFVGEVEELTDVVLGTLLFPLARPEAAIASLQKELVQATGMVQQTLHEVGARMASEISAHYQQANVFLNDLTASSQAFADSVTKTAETLTTAATELSAAAGQATLSTQKSLETAGLIQDEGLKLIASLETNTHSISKAIKGTEDKIGKLQPYYDAMSKQTTGIRLQLQELNQTQQSVRDDMKDALQGWQVVAKNLFSLKNMMQHTQMQAQLGMAQSREQITKEHQAFLLALQNVNSELVKRLVELSALEQRLHSEMRKRLAYVLGSKTPEDPSPVEELHARLNQFATEMGLLLDRLAKQAKVLSPPEAGLLQEYVPAQPEGAAAANGKRRVRATKRDPIPAAQVVDTEAGTASVQTADRLPGVDYEAASPPVQAVVRVEQKP